MSEQERIDFANAIYPEWDKAMDQFFRAVEHQRVRKGLSELDARDALSYGYGHEIADAWDEWVDA